MDWTHSETASRKTEEGLHKSDFILCFRYFFEPKKKKIGSMWSHQFIWIYQLNCHQKAIWMDFLYCKLMGYETIKFYFIFVSLCPFLSFFLFYTPKWLHLYTHLYIFKGNSLFFYSRVFSRSILLYNCTHIYILYLYIITGCIQRNFTYVADIFLHFEIPNFYSILISLEQSCQKYCTHK